MGNRLGGKKKRKERKEKKEEKKKTRIERKERKEKKEENKKNPNPVVKEKIIVDSQFLRRWCGLGRI